MFVYTLMHKCSSSSFILLHKASISWPEINKFVSSANRTDKKAFDTVAKSLIFIKNNKVDPWGTPQIIFSFVDFIELQVTYFDLFAK